MNHIEAMKQALEALEEFADHYEDCQQYPTFTRPDLEPPCDCGYEQAITSLRQAIEQAEKRHYCPEWDFLEITKDDPEFEACLCFSQKPDAWVADVGEPPTEDEKQDVEQSSTESKETFDQPVAWRAPNWGHSADEWVYRDADDPVLGLDGKPTPNNEPLYTAPQPQQAEKQEPVPWQGCDLDGMVEAFDRVIEAHFFRKNPFHNPIDADAQMALRILRGFIPYMKQYTTTQPQREWVGLTDEEIFEALGGIDCTRPTLIARAIEAKLRSKNT